MPGCASNDVGVEEAFVNADTFTFYTVDPHSPLKRDGGQVKADAEAVNEWIVLGKVDVPDKADRRKLLAAMQRGIDESDGSAAACFEPRHAMRIQSGTDSITYVICFACSRIVVHYGSGETESKLTSDSPSATFNNFAQSAELPVAE